MSFLQNNPIVPKTAFINAQQSGNYQMLAFTSRQLFKSQLILGLMVWRHGENPRPYLEKAVDRALTSIAAMTALNAQTVPERDFLVENLKTIAFLVDKPMAVEADYQLIEAPDRRLDCLLASEINTDKKSNSYTLIDAEISKLRKKTTAQLAAETYQTYFELLHESNAKNIDKKVKEVEKLYLRQASDSFYSGGEKTEGGSLDNGSVVDYRLAAILKKINYHGSSIHRWGW
ncbi:hypothetical protein HX882_07720 [Pseudomonas gingeri]|uniref:Uncharacterized protein n=1 Tax=Pseudomonas gingeri TaxID=117681 RepID=A0A7Y7X9V0_9PSED|nr:hypothetical protein [Pseudomonas gingeri]NWB95771.1 hypothetical protein [Pseudomonas gingeri]